MQDGQQPNEPGWVYKPGGTEPASTEPAVPAPAEAVAVQPAQEQPDPAPTADIQDPLPTGQPEANGEHIEWTASEYIANPKNAGWFAALIFASLVLAAIVFAITEELVPTAVIVIVGILFGIFAARQPRTLEYRIDNTGLHIGPKFYPYGAFKAFSVANEHAIGYIQLLPLRRFMPPLIIHYPPDDEDRIAEVLASYLPYEEHRHDVVESIAKKFRF